MHRATLLYYRSEYLNLFLHCTYVDWSVITGVVDIHGSANNRRNIVIDGMNKCIPKSKICQQEVSLVVLTDVLCVRSYIVTTSSSQEVSILMFKIFRGLA